MKNTLVKRGLRMLGRVAPRACGGPIEYRRGQVTVTIRATFGREDQTAMDEAGNVVRLEFSERDFIFPAEMLILGGRAAEPAPGDRIRVFDEGDDFNEEYEVMPGPGGRCWRSCDAQGYMIRVHAKKVNHA